MISIINEGNVKKIAGVVGAVGAYQAAKHLLSPKEKDWNSLTPKEQNLAKIEDWKHVIKTGEYNPKHLARALRTGMAKHEREIENLNDWHEIQHENQQILNKTNVKRATGALVAAGLTAKAVKAAIATGLVGKNKSGDADKHYYKSGDILKTLAND